MRVLASLLAALVVAAFAPAARADPVRILVAAAASRGTLGDQTLVHPDDDARAVRDVFAALGGVSPGDAIFLPGATPASLRAALDRAAELARAQPASEVSFFFYFSGHGDHDALHLAGDVVAMSELEARVAAIPASLKLVVIDACRGLRAKGMTSEPGFSVALRADETASGTAWLYASSDGEVAQESDEVGGALFSHFWTAGLEGAADTNGDGRVTLEESFEFAYAQTLLRSARSGGALQRPEERLALSHASPVVLTELATNRATLVLPADRDALYLVYAASARSLEAELFASPDRPTALVLPAGRYLVQRRVGSDGGAVEVLLPTGGRRVLEADSFRAFRADALALKGELVVHPWSVALFDEALGGVAAGAGDEGGIEVERRWGAVAIAARVFLGFDGWTTPANEVREESLGGELGLLRVWSLSSRFSARLGLDARAEWLSEQVQRRDAAYVEQAGYAGTGYFGGLAVGGGGRAELRFDISTTSFVAARATGVGLGAKGDAGGVVGWALFGGGVAVGVNLP